MTRRAKALALAMLLLGGGAERLHAYGIPTHAGLTERAALASSLHKKLARELERPLGLFEPLSIAAATAEAKTRLLSRLARLDPEGGFVPEQERQSALAWLLAGATSSDLGREPHPAGHAPTRAAQMPPPELARELDRFLEERERAASARSPGEREAATALWLSTAGSILHLLEDAGDPAHARGDPASSAGSGALDQFVADQYGRMGVPLEPGPLFQRAHLAEFFRDAKGEGLADRTAQRFFSPGTLPGSGGPAQPAVSPGPSAAGYVAGVVPHLIAYHRRAAGVDWFLDERCVRDYAKALLPEIERYGVSALDHLLRGRIDARVADGKVAITLTGDVELGRGTLAVYGDDGRGERARIAMVPLERAREGAILAEADLPETRVHVTAVFRGADQNGEPVVMVRELAVPGVLK